VSDQLTALSLYPVGKSPWYSLERRLGGPRDGLYDVEKRKFLILPGFELRHLGRPARSQSLYRLSYPGSFVFYCSLRKMFYSSFTTYLCIKKSNGSRRLIKEFIVKDGPSDNSFQFLSIKDVRLTHKLKPASRIGRSVHSN
jgi:hypothetical protein